MYNVLNMLDWDKSPRIKRFPRKNFMHLIKEDKKGTVPQSVKVHQHRTTKLASVNLPRTDQILNLSLLSKSRNDSMQPLPALLSKDFSPRRNTRYTKPTMYKHLVPLEKDKQSLSIEKYRVSRGSVAVTWNEKCMTIKKASISMSPKVKETTPSLTLDKPFNVEVVKKKRSYEYKNDRRSVLSLESLQSSESCDTLYNFYKYTMSPKIT